MRSSRQRQLTSIALAAWPLFAGCQGHRAASLRDADYPGALWPPATLGVEAVWQQHVTASWSDPDGTRRERAFDAAIQRRGDELTVVGLSPVGSVGFSVTQRVDGVDVVNNIPDQMVIPPRFILLDVQRAFYPWTKGGAGSEIVATRGGERIQERWQQGRIAERSFTRTSGTPRGAIRVSYDWGDNEWALPQRAVLDNGWFGYRLAITTTSETRLPAERAR